MSDLMDRIIADLVEGARRSEGFMRGSRANVEISRENRGREEKLASIGGALGGGLLGGGAGALGGGLAGAGTGALLAKLLHLDPSIGQELGGALGVGGAALGGLGGAAAGTAAGQDERKPSFLERMKGGSLETRYVDGVKAAAATFHIKEAFLPLLGSLVGGTALRAGAGALARGAGGKMLGGLAGKALPHMAGGIGGAATDMVGSMAGGALGQKMMPQQQPPPGM